MRSPPLGVMSVSALPCITSVGTVTLAAAVGRTAARRTDRQELAAGPSGWNDAVERALGVGAQPGLVEELGAAPLAQTVDPARCT